MLRAIAVCLVLSSLSVYAAFPTPRGYVNDFANVIDAQREAQIDALVRETARTTSAEIAVVTVTTLDGMTVEEYATKLFAAWGIGKKAKNNGVLILVAPSARAMRIEVGYGLEPVLPDGLAGEIIRTSFLPRFREGDYSAGIGDGVARVVSIVREGKRAAPGTVAPTADSHAAPPAFIFVPFLGLFVAVGAFMAGVGFRTRTTLLLIVGVVFAGIPLIMLLVTYPGLSLLTMLPLAAVVGTVGYAKAGAKKWREQVRGSAGADSTDWTTGSSSSSSDSSSGSSSSSDFGGGSSGGGGASGHW